MVFVSVSERTGRPNRGGSGWGNRWKLAEPLGEGEEVSSGHACYHSALGAQAKARFPTAVRRLRTIEWVEKAPHRRWGGWRWCVIRLPR